MNNPTKPVNWSVAIALAFATHALVALTFANLQTTGAQGQGEFGIEIGIGVLADLGLSNQRVEATIPTPEPELIEEQPETQETIAEPIEEPQIVQPEIEQPVFEPVVEVKQQAETVIQTVVEVERTEPLFDTREELVQAVADLVETTPKPAQLVRSTGTGDDLTTGGFASARASYIDKLFAKLNRFKHYPLAARRGPDEGTTMLYMLIRKDGHVLDAYVAESSGFTILDTAAMRMVEMAKPLPPIPADLRRNTLRIRIPVKFAISDG